MCMCTIPNSSRNFQGYLIQSCLKKTQQLFYDGRINQQLIGHNIVSLDPKRTKKLHYVPYPCLERVQIYHPPAVFSVFEAWFWSEGVKVNRVNCGVVYPKSSYKITPLICSKLYNSINWRIFYEPNCKMDLLALLLFIFNSLDSQPRYTYCMMKLISNITLLSLQCTIAYLLSFLLFLS